MEKKNVARKSTVPKKRTMHKIIMGSRLPYKKFPRRPKEAFLLKRNAFQQKANKNLEDWIGESRNPEERPEVTVECEDYDPEAFLDRLSYIVADWDKNQSDETKKNSKNLF
jgi:hypothetical protein